MGCSSSKAVSTGTNSPKRNFNEDDLNASLHGNRGGTRKNFVWVRENTPVTDEYDILEIVGQGSMGEVTIVTRTVSTLEKVTSRHHLHTKSSEDIQKLSMLKDVEIPDENKNGEEKKRRMFACKTINTTQFTQKEIEEFITEIDILRELDHPNIVQLYEVYQVKRKIWIVTELCTGGDLTSRLGKQNETQVAVIIEQVARAVFYMHKRNVCHRDVKLENILYANESPNSPVKLIDFGLSNKFTKGQRMLKACGTVYTAAPEVLLPGQGYTEKTDIWSLGVVAFVLLSESYPFMKGIEELKDDVKKSNLENARYKFGPEWDERNISDEAREFVEGCIRKNPGSRWIAKKCLDFTTKTWIPILELAAPSQGESRDALSHSVRAMRKRRKMDPETVDGMSRYLDYGEMKKTILMTMAYTMDKSSLEELSEMFTVIDSTGNGTVSLAELKKALSEMDSETHLDDETIEKLFHGIDVDNSGQIHYNEFLAAVVESQGLITMEHLAEAFDRLDTNGKGYISKEDIKNLLGTDYNEEKVNRMIDEADFKKNGQVDYDEFLRLMFENPEKGLKTIGTTRFAADVQMAEGLATIQPAGKIGPIEE